MPLTDEIQATGTLHRAALHYDMCAAMNRWQLTKNGDELNTLLPDQMIMLLLAANEKPGSTLWCYVEQRLGRSLIPENGTP